VARRLAVAALAAGVALAAFPGASGGEEPPGDREHGRRPAEGRWKRFRPPPETGTPGGGREEVESLIALGYVSGSRPAQARGVTRHDPYRAWPGLNLCCSGHAPEAMLMDMEGDVLHRWSCSFEQAFQEEGTRRSTEFWRRVHLFPNGDLLAIFEGQGIVKLDRDSRLLWARRNGAHHDLEVTPDGDIWVLTRAAARLQLEGEWRRLAEDFVSVLDPDGNETRRYSLLDAFRDTEHEGVWISTGNLEGDVLHTNTIHLLDGRIAGRVPAFRAGNVLTSMLQLDAIAVLDTETGKIAWTARGDFHRQHDPKILPDGHLLLFDNGAEGAETSSVLELDPDTGREAWRWRGTEAEPFFSYTCGTADRLPNGNTLVTESDNGRAFELSPDGEIVWEFYNPHVGGPDGEFIATLFDVVRLPADFPVEWATAGVESPLRPGRP